MKQLHVLLKGLRHRESSQMRECCCRKRRTESVFCLFLLTSTGWKSSQRNTCSVRGAPRRPSLMQHKQPVVSQGATCCNYFLKGDRNVEGFLVMTVRLQTFFHSRCLLNILGRVSDLVMERVREKTEGSDKDIPTGDPKRGHKASAISQWGKK